MDWAQRARLEANHLNRMIEAPETGDDIGHLGRNSPFWINSTLIIDDADRDRSKRYIQSSVIGYHGLSLLKARETHRSRSHKELASMKAAQLPMLLAISRSSEPPAIRAALPLKPDTCRRFAKGEQSQVFRGSSNGISA